MLTPSVRLLASLALVGSLACSEGPAALHDNTPPLVTILQPQPAQFAGGDSIEIAASAADPEQGTLPASAFEWWVLLHHGEHTHPVVGATPGATGRFHVPRAGHFDADVFYRISVRATDAQGLSDTAFVDLSPRLMQLTLTTIPPGLEVTLDHQPHTSPYTVTSIVGMERAIGVPASQPFGGLQYVFAIWTHGGAAIQTIVTGATDQTFTAWLEEAGVANVPPAVEITAPSPGSIVTAGSTVAIEATASDSDGSITHVQFFVGDTLLVADSTAPFVHAWVPAGTGSRSLSARAFDDDQASAVSPAVLITVQSAVPGDGLAPTVVLDSPADSTLGLIGAVTVTATATDNVGVTLVEFELDGAPMGSDATPPFEATLPSTSDYASGVHVFRARARDAAGNWSDWDANRVTFGGSVALPAGFTRSTFASGFGDILTAVAAADDGRLFVAEKSGKLRVVKAGALLPRSFIDVDVNSEGERGLLGVALHPNFAINGFVYVYYTTNDGAPHNRISRFAANGDTVVGGEQVLVNLPPLLGAVKHNGGALHFGIDGKLYVAVGDITDGSLAPSLGSTFGKILRFNPDGSIPGDNPFLTQTTGLNRAIWARGLRNPFTFAIDPGTGRMHINDVGQSQWEEINLGRAGADYGWPATEGPTDNPAYDAPILAYGHSNSPTLFNGNAVVGGAFYRPQVNLFGEEFVGDYFFADYVAGWIYRLDHAAGNAAYAFAQLDGFPTNLTVAADGALYVLIGNRVDRISR